MTLLVLVCSLGCQKAGGEASSCPPCSAGFRADLAREAEIEATWHSVAADVAPSAPLSFRCSCFGRGTSTSIEGQSLQLPDTWSVREQTARAAHLAAHRVLPPWSASGSCDERVKRALEREADAHALELDTRRALGVAMQRYPFESQYFAAPAGERRPVLLQYFMTHPEDGAEVPGFITRYRARCAD